MTNTPAQAPDALPAEYVRLRDELEVASFEAGNNDFDTLLIFSRNELDNYILTLLALAAEVERVKGERDAQLARADANEAEIVRWHRASACWESINDDRIAERDTARASLSTLQSRCAALEGALRKIACFNDDYGNSWLERFDNYSGFDEPHSVRESRAALAAPVATGET